ncbi:MAG TPA: hypothetical protein VG347_20285 [Verrucomicrobiae bacterium]|nr:hypothetical protein [Verrucomicrobiae bacterium]
MKCFASGLLGLWLLASAMQAVAEDVRPALPPEAEMSPGADRGRHIFVIVRVGHGSDLPFVLDTGASTTVFDESLAPQLGRAIALSASWRFGVQKEEGVYTAPHFYLGGTRLLGGKTVSTADFKNVSKDIGRPVRGLIGMDVLGNYCVQLDFAAGKVRFLDGDQADKSKWGKAIPLTDLGDGCMAVRENLAGSTEVGSLIDTGDNGDGWLVPEVYQQWTNQTRVLTGSETASPQGILAGEKYRHLELRGLDAKMVVSGDPHMRVNGIGLRVLSRYVVTLDFPDRTMYLRRPSAWSKIF